MTRRGKPHLGLVEDALKLDARDMRRLGVFQPESCGEFTWDLKLGHARSRLAEARYTTSEGELILDFTDGRREFRQTIRIVRQECHLGGYRKWFLCPHRGPAGVCFRRVRCLYFPKWADQFGCRHCHRLIHRSAREHDARVNDLSFDFLKIDEILATPDVPSWQVFLCSKAIVRGTKYPERCLKRLCRDVRKGRIPRERLTQSWPPR